MSDPNTSTQFKLRIRYGKIGRLRFLAHLELLRTLERIIRRSGLPYAITQGFSPRMKLGLSNALSVATASQDEYIDVSLTSFVDPDKACSMLQAVTVADIPIYEAKYVHPKFDSISAYLNYADYDIYLRLLDETADKSEAVSTLNTAVESVIAGETIEREHKGKIKVINVANALPEPVEIIELAQADCEASSFDLCIHVTIRLAEQGASLRPELLLGRLAELTELFCAQDVGYVRTMQYTVDDEGIKRNAWGEPLS